MLNGDAAARGRHAAEPGGRHHDNATMMSQPSSGPRAERCRTSRSPGKTGPTTGDEEEEEEDEEEEEGEEERRPASACLSCGLAYDVALLLPCSHTLCGRCVGGGAEGAWPRGRSRGAGRTACAVLCPRCARPVELPCWEWASASRCLPRDPTLSRGRSHRERRVEEAELQPCPQAQEQVGVFCLDTADDVTARRSLHDPRSPTPPLEGAVDLREEDMEKSVSGLSFVLDPSTAAPSLRLSHSSLAVTFCHHGDGGACPETDSAPLPQVCADVIISRGQYYWEVDVCNSTLYRIGASSLDGYSAGASSLDGYSAGASSLDGYSAGASSLDGYSAGASSLDGYSAGASSLDGYSAGASSLDGYSAGASSLDGYSAGASPLDGPRGWWMERRGASFSVVYDDGRREPLRAVPPRIKTLGVFLNVGGGALSFHNAVTQEHLATLPARFGRAGVRPALALGQGRLRLRCGLPPPPHVFLSRASAYRGPSGAGGGRWRRDVSFRSVRTVIQRFEELAAAGSGSDSGLVSSFGSSFSTLASVTDQDGPGAGRSLSPESALFSGHGGEGREGVE